jgi:hypothetical protein
MKVWSVSVRKEVASLSPGGKNIVSGNGDNLVKVRSVSTRMEIASLAERTNWILEVVTTWLLGYFHNLVCFNVRTSKVYQINGIIEYVVSLELLHGKTSPGL